MSKEAWDTRYRVDEYIYGTRPNEFFKSQLEGMSPGHIFLPGEGEGRNAVFAAQNGWNVLAMDQSSEGREKALKLAGETGVTIQYESGDICTAALPAGAFDVVALIYLHLPAELRVDFHRKMAEVLRPGGQILLEAFTPEQLNFTSGGPGDVRMLYTSAMLAEDFAGLDILLNQEMAVFHDEGTYHRGEARVVRLVARRPFSAQE